MWSVSVILKTTLIKHRHDKEKFDADHFYGGYHHHHHHHHYHHHHHHHKHHYCYRVQKPLLSICLSSELSLSIIYYFQVILFVIIFVTILLSFVVVLCGTCFILLLLFWGGREWWGLLTSLGYLSGLCSGPWHLSQVIRKS